MVNDNKEILFFESKEAFEQWLELNYNKQEGIWLKFAKKSSGINSVYYSDALDVALCYGWIDGQAKPFDEKYYLQKFTPRRSKSIWSKRNIQNVERLVKEGRMKPSGHQQIEAAKADGRWEAAYDSQANMVIPEDFIEELKKDTKASAFFESLNKTNKFSIAFRLQTAKKTETREKRMREILGMMARGEKFHN